MKKHFSVFFVSKSVINNYGLRSLMIGDAMVVVIHIKLQED